MTWHVYEETTQWSEVDSSDNCNHVYVFTDKPSGRLATIVGYVKRGSQTVERFGKPLKIDLKGRTFRPLK
jgi:hypothetical protein